MTVSVIVLAFIMIQNNPTLYLVFLSACSLVTSFQHHVDYVDMFFYKKISDTQ